MKMEATLFQMLIHLPLPLRLNLSRTSDSDETDEDGLVSFSLFDVVRIYQLTKIDPKESALLKGSVW